MPVRLSPSGPFVDWKEEFAHTALGVISRFGQDQGPTQDLALLASQTEGQLVLAIPFELTAANFATLASGDYNLQYICHTNFEVKAIDLDETNGGALSVEFMIAGAGGGGGRRYITSHRQWDDGATENNERMCSGAMSAILTMNDIYNAGGTYWNVGTNYVQLGLSFPGAATGTVTQYRTRLTVVEVVGGPIDVSP